MDESETLRGRGTVLGFDAGNEDLRMRSVDKYSLSNKTKDGEPCALKGASTVRRGGHAMPSGPTVPTLPMVGRHGRPEGGYISLHRALDTIRCTQGRAIK